MMVSPRATGQHLNTVRVQYLSQDSREVGKKEDFTHKDGVHFGQGPSARHPRIVPRTAAAGHRLLGECVVELQLSVGSAFGTFFG